jgi:hypothetical protein
MLGESVVETLQIGCHGGGKTEQREIAKKHESSDG